jgi:uncharacterized protein YcgI (DUF1989 family)
MAKSETTVTDEWAPRPWRVEAPNKQHLQIVDAAGNPVCDFFPFAGKGGRGWDATRVIADQIVERTNA